MKLLQIGSHRGNDDFTTIVKKYNPKEVEFLLLIEPNSEFNRDLKNCYFNYNPIIENIVVNNDEEVENSKLYFCNKTIYPDTEKTRYSELSSLDKEHLVKHGIKINHIDEKFITCSTINNILEKYKIESLDILFIDVEGFDYHLVKSINFEKFKIEKIFYENLHINNDVMISFLESKGYEINRNVLMNGWTSEATKKNS